MEIKINDYTDDQLRILVQAKSKGLDIRKILNPEFEPSQMELITNALEEGINVDIISNPKLGSMNMRILIKAIKENIDITDLVNPILYWRQTEALCEAKSKGIDITGLNSVSLREEVLEELLKARSEGINIDELIDPYFNIYHIQMLIKAKKDGLDISKILHLLKPNYSPSILDTLLDAVKHNIDLSEIDVSNFSTFSLYKLIEAKKIGMDIEKYLSLPDEYIVNAIHEDLIEFKKEKEKQMSISELNSYINTLEENDRQTKTLVPKK